MQDKLGIRRDFGLFNDAVANYSSVYFYYVWELPIFAAMGAVGGLLGFIFIFANKHITSVRRKYIKVRYPVRRLLEVSTNRPMSLGKHTRMHVRSHVWHGCAHVHELDAHRMTYYQRAPQVCQTALLCPGLLEVSSLRPHVTLQAICMHSASHMHALCH